MTEPCLANVVIVLVGTKHPGNLGSVARAMNNMGLDCLRLVSPQCSVDEEAVRMARAGAPLLERAKSYRTVQESIADLHLIIGTTAKKGGYRSHTHAPRALAQRIIDQAADQMVGILFGPEDSGLVDGDLGLCQQLVRIPTAPRAGSLNLAQAVLVLCYELFLARTRRKPARVPQLAPAADVEAMYDQLEVALREIGFLHAGNARHMMFALRRFLGRGGLEIADVGILRGIARQIGWHASRGHRD